MVRRDLLERALPFPEPFGAAFHDHWLAATALAAGDLAYLDRPLYDYVQHGGNVIGQIAPPTPPAWKRAELWLRWFWPTKVPRNVRRDLGYGRGHYFANLLRVWQVAQAVALRCGDVLDAAKRRAVNRVLAARSGPLGWLWLWARPFRFPGGVGDTVGMEYYLLNALLWRQAVRAFGGAWAGAFRAPHEILSRAGAVPPGLRAA